MHLLSWIGGFGCIVFVLTMNEAFDKKLHFGMLRDAYVRILTADHAELVSFPMEEYYDTVISMMIGDYISIKALGSFMPSVMVWPKIWPESAGFMV